MMKQLKRFAARFRRSEDGSASVEFVLYFTVFFMVLSAGVEIAYINLRHAMLERAVDLTTRDIRLATGDLPTYEDVRAKICDEAAILDGCESNLRLEMVQVDPRDTAAIPYDADCQNAAEEPRPVRNFIPGNDNDLMLIKACLKYKPMMPTSEFAQALNIDDQGYAQLVVTAAFVQEPR